MPVTLRDVTGVSGVQEFRPETAVRPKHGHAHIAVDNVLPFISVGMPVQLAKSAGFKVENDAVIVVEIGEGEEEGGGGR